MSQEIFWLSVTAFMTGLLWMPYVLGRFFEFGIFTVVLEGTPNFSSKSDWAVRAQKAHQNAIENLVIFAALILSIEVAGMGTELTATVASLYFFARLAHYIVYTLGLSVVRTVAFLAAFGCQMVLALTLLGLV